MVAQIMRCIQASQLLSRKSIRAIYKASHEASRSKKRRILSTSKLEPATPIPRTNSKNSLTISSSSRINRIRYHPVPLFIGGLAVAYCAGYLAFTTAQLYRAESLPIPVDASAQEDVSSRYDSIAYNFDDTVDSSEYWLGITSLRKKLVQRAQGHVLEVSIGTGRNLPYYDWDLQGYNGVGRPDARNVIKRGKVKSFTAVDSSLEMLEIAHTKLEKLIPGFQYVRWILGDATATCTIPDLPRSLVWKDEKGSEKYDTIIQTMGLCSVKNPVGLLRNLGEHVKEEEGRILLLEHGRGRWRWLNTILDKTAKDHAQAFGCWWNRDIQNIVKESGLEIVQMKTPKWWHGGTTWWVELKKVRPKPCKTEA